MRFLEMLCIILLALTGFAAIYINTPKFGSLPSMERLERIKKSPHYRDGRFHNTVDDRPFDVSNLTKILSLLRSFCAVLTNQNQRVHIPSIKTNISNLDMQEDILIWFGHSSYFIQIEELRVLVDPVFSEVSSPIPWFPKAFPGSNVYNPSDIPDVDYLIITHDHWDHLDYETVRNLKFQKVICPLGVGAHFEHWGLENIIEMDWDENIELSNGFKICCLRSRHFSGRGFLRNRTLWASFFIESPMGFKIFIGGDGGYDDRFSEFSKRFGKVDLAILENGQYNNGWPSIHMHPEETIKAAEELNAEALLPVHVAKFSLATHKWNDSLQKIDELSKDKHLRLLTPMIGQKVHLKNKDQAFEKWWMN
jgi:L-ascorbate metabolism protein UlaG (beta-lactamase superfamily)